MATSFQGAEKTAPSTTSSMIAYYFNPLSALVHDDPQWILLGQVSSLVAIAVAIVTMTEFYLASEIIKSGGSMHEPALANNVYGLVSLACSSSTAALGAASGFSLRYDTSVVRRSVVLAMDVTALLTFIYLFRST
ncbi:hypothetical protein CC2G_006606 [Coprinopsis cinerea AmutBmut pab1-1]|nr:hypothetical protein CC2G_006606 [Coprinopsis cinerea AmutBmut pab1-1]